MTTPPGPSRREFLGRSAAFCAAASLASAADSPQTAPHADTREAYRIGCYTRPWGELDYREALDAIAEAGFEYCGLMTAKGGLVLSVNTTAKQAAAVGEELRERKLKVISAYCGDIPLDSREHAVEGMRRLIDHCAAVGSLNLLMGGVAQVKAQELYYGAIAACCDEAARKKVEISVKPHGGLNATGPQVRKTVEKVNHPNFRVWYDAGNIFYYSKGELDPVDDAPSVEGCVTGWCIKDYLPPGNVDVNPGSGKVDFKKVFELLRKGGFVRGSLVIETLGQQDRSQRVKEAAKARAFLEQLVGPKRQAPAAGR